MSAGPAEHKIDTGPRSPLTDGVHVVAPARLHLGFLDLNGDLGRRFGSLGLAVDQPATELVIRHSDRDRVEGPERERVLKALARFKESLGLTGSYAVEIQRAIPAHAGLGSGTQLALAVGAGLAALEGREEGSQGLGEMLDRGARSAIGMAAFAVGGFFIDGGRGERDAAPPVTVRQRFPEEWRAILVTDPAFTGVHGETETKAFRRLEPMPAEQSGRLCRLVLMRLLPALKEQDIAAFGAAVTEIQQILGQHFASAQGGVWSSGRVEEIVRRLGAAGAVGLGQSSWGPTGFAFVPHQDAADRLYHSLVDSAKAQGLNLTIVRGRNRGATVEATSGAETANKPGRSS